MIKTKEQILAIYHWVIVSEQPLILKNKFGVELNESQSKNKLLEVSAKYSDDVTPQFAIGQKVVIMGKLETNITAFSKDENGIILYHFINNENNLSREKQEFIKCASTVPTIGKIQAKLKDDIFGELMSLENRDEFDFSRIETLINEAFEQVKNLKQCKQ